METIPHDNDAEQADVWPNDRDAENLFLCACLADDGKELARILSEISDAVQLLYDPRNRLILSTAAKVGGEYVALTTALKGKSGFSLEDQRAYITGILNLNVGPDAASYYAEKLRPLAKRRLQIEGATQLNRAARDGDDQGATDALKIIIEATAAPAIAIEAKSICDLKRRQQNDPNELLRHDFLSRGGAGLLVAPTGVGKSVGESQFAIGWGVGKTVLGIEPVRPLKSLIVQAEDDDADRAEMRDGAFYGLSLTHSQIEQVRERVVIHHECSRTGDRFLSQVVEPLLQKHAPDLLWINPLNSYLGGDVCDQALVSKFLRNGINPLLQKYQCAAIIIHHTNKPPSGKEKPTWSGGDFAYLGSGSSELANWARAVLAIRSIGSHDVFSLYAGKRGKRLRWTAADGSPTMQRLIGHSDHAGILYWREVDESEIESKKPPTTPEAFLAHVPTEGHIAKPQLLTVARANGFGKHAADDMLTQLIDAKRLFVSKRPRPGTNAQILISRYDHA